MKKIRDAVHGDIQLTKFELDILNTSIVQRLRGIKQLGTTHLVYPCAVHTRFEHSLGTCFVTKKIISAINTNMLSQYGVLDAIDEHESELLSAVALLHDISHIPYGHTFEDERKLFERHDSIERISYFLENRQLKKVLGNMGKDILKVLSVKSSLGIPKQEKRPYLFQIVCDTICADLLDYISRDLYFCGLTGSFDNRIFSDIILDEKNHVILNLVKNNGMFRSDTFSEILNLLRLRYLLTERVYFHHTKVSAGAMISKAMEYAVERGIKNTDLFKYSDEMFLSYLEKNSGASGKLIMKRFKNRDIYKKVFVITKKGISLEKQKELISFYHDSISKRRTAEEDIVEIANKKGIPLKLEDIILYCPAQNMSFKEAEVFVRAQLNSAAKPLCMYKNKEIEVLMEKYKNLWRFFIFVSSDKIKHFDKISAICEEYFDVFNELIKEQKGQIIIDLN